MYAPSVPRFVETGILPPNGRSSLEDVLKLFNPDDPNVEVIVSDAEYLNETLGKIVRGPRPTDKHWKEVAQIGAVLYRGGQRVASFSEYVVPRVKAAQCTDDQWEHFVEITNIPKETVMAGDKFEHVWDRFMAFVGKRPIVVIAGDREVYKWNWALLGSERDADIDAMEWIILKPLLPVHLRTTPDNKPILSGELYQYVGVKAEDVCEGKTTHDGLFDASSMAIFLAECAKNGTVPPPPAPPSTAEPTVTTAANN